MGVLLAIYYPRTAMIGSLAIHGLVLGVIGAGWVFIVPFLIAPVIGLLLTFPTQKRLDEMAAIIESLIAKVAEN